MPLQPNIASRKDLLHLLQTREPQNTGTMRLPASNNPAWLELLFFGPCDGISCGHGFNSFAVESTCLCCRTGQRFPHLVNQVWCCTNYSYLNKTKKLSSHPAAMAACSWEIACQRSALHGDQCMTAWVGTEVTLTKNNSLKFM